MLALASRFLWLGYGLVWIIAACFFLLLPRARRASMRFLQRVDAAASANAPRPRQQPRGRCAFQSYRHFVEYGRLLLDRALVLARPHHGFTIDCSGLIHLRNAAETSRGVILLSAHFGMTEIAAPYVGKMGIGRRMNIVMYQDPRDGTEQFHLKYRHMLQDVNVISTIDPLAAGVRIMAALSRGEIVAMRADRTLDGKGTTARLLGETLQLPAGPFIAAALSGARVLYVDTLRVGHRHYRCLISEAPAHGTPTREHYIARAAADFAAHLDQIVPRYPLQWGNFFDLWATQPTS
jgi:predicted LPLAT superfamily acyltransferase